MKIIYSLILFIALFSSCKSNKSYLERNDEDKALQDAVKKLNKSADDEKALEAIPVLYKSISVTHLEKIKSFQTSRELSKWDKIIKEYSALQNAYDVIIESAPAFRLISPISYTTEILNSKQKAAQDYYDAALVLLNKPGRENAKKAYGYFKKSDKYEPGFKDATLQMRNAYEKAIVNIIVNPVQDNSFFFNSGWGNAGYNYSNEYFQQTLVRDLRNNEERYAANFYTDWEARRENIQPDWIVDLRLRNMDIPYPQRNSYSRNVSAQVQIGTDTSGRPVTRTVYATLQVIRSSFQARADMEVLVKDLITGKTVLNNTYRDDYRWQEETATYTGDSRALSAGDWQLINNNGYYTPSRDEILQQLYSKIYPQVKNNVGYAVEW